MLKICDFSKLSRISIRMLRHYDEIGLLAPESIDPITGYRYYREAQLSEAQRIVSLREMGFGLSSIAALVQSEDPGLMEQALKAQRRELMLQMHQLQTQLRLLDTALIRLRKDPEMTSYEISLKQMPARKVASVRQIIPRYEEEGRLWHILMKEITPLHVKGGRMDQSVAIFHDREFKDHDVDVEIQYAVSGEYPDTEHVTFKDEPAFVYASAIMRGSYEQADLINQSIACWIRDNGYEFNGPMFNIYIVSPNQTQNPDEWVTEVCYPVRKK